MARTDNITNFLTDVADAIKEKTGDSTAIPASQFDAKIAEIETGGIYQDKNLDISQNGNYVLNPDSGYDAMTSVTIGVNVSEEGPDTADATAVASDIISPKTAYTKEGKVTGTIESVYGGTQIVLDSKTFMNTNTTVNDANYTYNIGVSCGTDRKTVYVYKLYNGVNPEVKDTITLTYYGYAGTARFAAQPVIIDDVTYVRCFVTDCTGSANGTVGVNTFLVNVSSYEIVDESIKRVGFNTGNTAPAIEAVPFTDNKCVIQVNYNSSSLGYSRTGLFTCTNSLTNTISVTTLKNWSGNTNNYSPDTAYHSLQFSPDGRYLCSHYYGSGKYNSYVRHSLILYSTDHFTTYTVKKDDGGTRSNNIYKIINNDYYTYNGTMYSLSTLTSIGKSFPVTPSSDAILLALGNYIFYASSPTATSMNVYLADGSNIIFNKTINDIKASSIYYHYGDTIMYTTSGMICWYVTDKKLLSLMRIGEYFYNTDDANVTAGQVLKDKIFYGSAGASVGTMANNGYLSYTPSTSSQSIPSGYTSGGLISAVTSAIDVNITAGNIRNGVTILGVEGTFEGSQGGDATSDGNLQAKYLLEGYSAVVDGQLIQGTMVDRGAVTITATSSDIVIPEGHYTSLSIPAINAANCEDYTECSEALASI